MVQLYPDLFNQIDHDYWDSDDKWDKKVDLNPIHIQFQPKF